jgi:acyl-CoA dehydrogenase
MDIHGGAGICTGYSNFLQKFYRSIPIGITVEGSNTLTRSLIIFSQGLNKSHPYIFSIVEDILDNDVERFWNDFCAMVKQVLKLYSYSFSRERSLEQQIVQFATLTNFVALKGGKIKREQMLSGEMADVFGNLYLGISLLYEKSNSQILHDYCMKRILSENQVKINKIVDNLELELKIFLFHLKRKPNLISFQEENAFWKEVVQNHQIKEKIKEHIYTEDSVLHDMEMLLKMDPTDIKYEEIRKRIINVGEYPL